MKRNNQSTFNFPPESIGTAGHDDVPAVFPLKAFNGEPYDRTTCSVHHFSPTEFVVVPPGTPFQLADYRVQSPAPAAADAPESADV